ncbi:MAG: DUF1573 domain-containing protein, partial [Phycisphaerales bacterium]|nr:DUF1573 domain-containing protein [Phycisphaerales bacterium]
TRSALVLAGLVMALGTPARADDPTAATSASRPGEHPLLNFPVTEIDLGPISDAQRITTPFRFTNISGKPIRLMLDGCHLCGLPTSDKPAYAPGESGTIFIDIDPIGRRGPVRGIGGIGVAGATPGRATPEGLVQLLVRAEVRPLVWIDPPEMMVPELVRREARPLVFTVSGRSPDPSRPFEITEAASGSEHATLELSPPARVETADDRFTQYTATLRLKPDAPLGPLGMNVRFATTSDAAPVLNYPISTTVRGDLTAEPDPVIVGTLAPGDPFVGSFQVRSREPGVALGLTTLDVPVPGLSTAITLDARPAAGAATWTVFVRGIAPRREVMFDEVTIAVTATTALGGEETIVVPLRMAVRLPPEPVR